MMAVAQTADSLLAVMPSVRAAAARWRLMLDFHASGTGGAAHGAANQRPPSFAPHSTVQGHWLRCVPPKPLAWKPSISQDLGFLRLPVPHTLDQGYRRSGKSGKMAPKSVTNPILTNIFKTFLWF